MIGPKEDAALGRENTGEGQDREAANEKREDGAALGI